MRIQLYKIYEIFSIPLISYFLVACASEPIRVDRSVNDPVNTLSQETAFIPPPNPFHGQIQMQTESSFPVTKDEPAPVHQHPMTHQMDNKSESKTKSDVEMEVHHHQEHKQ